MSLEANGIGNNFGSQQPHLQGTLLEKITIEDIKADKTPSNNDSTKSSSSKSKSWDKLNQKEKAKVVLDTSFTWLVRPVCLISTVSSVLSCVLANLFDEDNEYLDKTSELSNRFAYFINGIYGAFENFNSHCLPGGIGYGLVSLSSIIGTKENMYLLKGPGSALDQVPAMIDEVSRNPAILKKYNLADVKNNGFNEYANYWESIEKTFFATKFVLTDIYKEFKTKLLKGQVWDFFKAFIVKSNSREEKNLVVSSLGILAGVGLALIGGMTKLGASLRDIFGIHADLGLFGKENFWYKLCGAFYTVGSGTDLIYRWTQIPKLELAAVGMDNLGFMFMTWANRNVIRDVENKSNGKKK